MSTEIDTLKLIAAKGTFKSTEEFYQEIAWHCYVHNMSAGMAYEGMRHDFNKLWESRKEYLVNHICEQLVQNEKGNA